MAVRAWLRVYLSQIGRWAEGYGMVYRTPCGAMVVTGKVGRMTIFALASAIQRRPFQAAVADVMAGGATVGGMDLTRSHEWRRGRAMAADTIDAVRGG